MLHGDGDADSFHGRRLGMLETSCRNHWWRWSQPHIGSLLIARNNHGRMTDVHLRGNRNVPVWTAAGIVLTSFCSRRETCYCEKKQENQNRAGEKSRRVVSVCELEQISHCDL